MRASEDLIIGLKGFGMGAANVVPGVSGGTIALLTGIYSRLIEALNSIMDPQVWKRLFKGGGLKAFLKEIDARFLFDILVGAVLSILLLAKILGYMMDAHPVQTWAFFFGLIVASSVFLLTDIKDWRVRDVLLTLGGLVLGVLICTLSPTDTPDGLWFIFICGALAICTMILPGISGSFVLLILGKYEVVMDAVSNFDIPLLAVFALGCAAGLLAFAKLLHYLLARAEKETLLVLIGFVIGSLVKVWPWADEAARIAADGTADNMHIPGAVIWAAAGAALVVVIELLGKKASKQNP